MKNKERDNYIQNRHTSEYFYNMMQIVDFIWTFKRYETTSLIGLDPKVKLLSLSIKEPTSME